MQLEAGVSGHRVRQNLRILVHFFMSERPTALRVRKPLPGWL